MRPRVGINGKEHYMEKQHKKGMAIGKPREYSRESRKSELTKHRIRELGTRVHSWRIHVDVWQNQYNIVK